MVSVNVRPAPYPQGHIVRLNQAPGQPGFNNPHNHPQQVGFPLQLLCSQKLNMTLNDSKARIYRSLCEVLGAM